MSGTEVNQGQEDQLQWVVSTRDQDSEDSGTQD